MYLSHMQAGKAKTSLGKHASSLETSMFAHKVGTQVNAEAKTYTSIPTR